MLISDKPGLSVMALNVKVNPPEVAYNLTLKRTRNGGSALTK